MLRFLSFFPHFLKNTKNIFSPPHKIPKIFSLFLSKINLEFPSQVDRIPDFGLAPYWLRSSIKLP